MTTLSKSRHQCNSPCDFIVMKTIMKLRVCLLILCPLMRRPTFSQIIRPLSIWKITKLPVVTRFEGIEEYYLSLRPQYESDIHPQEVAHPRKRANIKKQICQSVFNAMYFEMHKLEWVDIDNGEARSELKEHYPYIFDKIFKKNDDPSSLDFKYENSYSSRKIQIKGISYEEYGFVCPSRSTKSPYEIKEFVVSREYNVNLVEEQYSIAGRFVFGHSDKNQLILLALAEESGTELVPWPLRNSIVGNIFNLTERYNEDLFATLTENPNLDSVCQLEDGFKLRLCAILFGANSFKNKVIFHPVMNNILPQCKKKTISIIGTETITDFLDKYIRPSWGRIFEEWVVGCQAMKTNTGDAEIYYVSRGMWPNSVFMYKDAGNKQLSTYNYFYNVSVAQE